jgi:hypothetical protein
MDHFESLTRSHRHRPFIAIALLLASLTGAGADAIDGKPKLGPHAVTIQQSHDYLQRNGAPDYWALSPYYVPQITGSACSLATVVTMLNALRGLPLRASDELVTQQTLLEAVNDEAWAKASAQGGAGVTFAEFTRYVAASLKAFNLDATIEVFRPLDSSPAALDRLRHILGENERSDMDIALVYYNQGVITGDWDGPHLSPIGAYDDAQRRVLIMDVDRQFYIPYWASDEKLLEAMLRPAPGDHGRLAGETGGIVRVTLRPPARRASPQP